MALAKLRTEHGLTMAAGKPAAQSWPKGCLSYPPVASITTSSTPWLRQKAASASMPSMVLGNCCQAPLRPTRASRVSEPASTPQMTSVTVTCLVDATGNRATVRSCVTPRRLVPRLPCGYGLGGRGRQLPRTGSGGHWTRCSTIVADPTCRGPDTRGLPYRLRLRAGDPVGGGHRQAQRRRDLPPG